MSNPELQRENIAIEATEKAWVEITPEEQRQRALQVRVSAIYTSLLDAMFLVVWALITYIVSRILGELELKSVIDKTIAFTFQVIFAISTLVPVMTYTIVDVVKTIKHGIREVKK